jgi:hypothetical protein
MTPELANALRNAFADQEARAPQIPVNPNAQPVLPVQPSGPPLQHGVEGGAGSLSLAPAGLASVPTGAPGAPASQGGSIAMAGMLPPIQNATFTSPLINQTAASSGSGMGLSPIPFPTLQGWGWGGGGGGGFDFGGGGGGFDFGSMPMGSTGGW